MNGLELHEFIELLLCLGFFCCVIYQLRKFCVVWFNNKHERELLKMRQEHELKMMKKQMEKQ